MAREAPMIDNPDYKGEWKAKQIDNPDYKEDNELHARCENCKYVGFELWQVKAGTIFDDIIITDSVDEAKAFAKETFFAKKDGEKKAKDDADAKAAKEAEEKAAKAEEDAKEDDEDDESDEKKDEL